MKKALWTLVVGFVCIIYGIYIIISNHRYMFGGKPADLNQMIKDNPDISSSEIENKDVVSLRVDLSFGCFAIEKSRSYGIPIGDKKFYLVYLEDNSVMAVAVKGSDIKKMDAVTTRSLNLSGYGASSMIRLEGAVYRISSGDLKKYYDNALTNLGIKGVEGNQIKMRYIYIDASDNKKSMWLVSILFIVVGVIMLFGETIIFAIKERGKKKAAGTVDVRTRENPVQRNISTNNNIPEQNKPFSVGEHYKKLHETEEDAGLKTEEEDVPFNRTDTSDRTKDGKLSTDGWNLLK